MQNTIQRIKFQRAKAAILFQDEHQSLENIIAADRDAFSGLRVVYASDSSGTPIQAALEATGCMTSLFCGRGVHVFPSEVESQMRSGRAEIQFRVRAMLDTNLLSDMPKFFTGDLLSTRERVKTALQFVVENIDGQIDWTFASLENLREARKTTNPWPLLKVAAAHHFCKRGLAPIGKDELLGYMPVAESQWRSWLASEECWRQITRRDLFYAVMLFSVRECWNGSPVNVAMSNLVDFCLDSFNIIPLKELYFGWKAIRGIYEPKGRLAIFAERALRSPSKDSLMRISALAWDLFIFRWCETLMTELKGTTFYIPAVTTLDEDLLATIKACPLRAILIDDIGKTVEAIFFDELDFQTCLHNSISNATRIRIADPERQIKHKSISTEALSRVIRYLEGEVVEMVNASKNSTAST